MQLTLPIRTPALRHANTEHTATACAVFSMPTSATLLDTLREYLNADPERRCRLSTRAIAKATGLSWPFVDRYRNRFTPEHLRDADRIGRSGAVVRSRGRRLTAEQRTALRIGELERALAAAEKRAAAAEAQAEASQRAAAQAAKDADNARRAQSRLQSRQKELRSTDAAMLRVLCEELLWHGWEPSQLTHAVQEGELLSHDGVLELTRMQQQIVRELAGKREAEVMQHYQVRWGREGYGDDARAEAAALGLSTSQFLDPDNPHRRQTSDAKRWADARRDGWVLEQLEARPVPDGDVEPFAPWIIVEVEVVDVPDGVPVVGGVDELTPAAVADAMRGGVVVVRSGGRTFVVQDER